MGRCPWGAQRAYRVWLELDTTGSAPFYTTAGFWLWHDDYANPSFYLRQQYQPLTDGILYVAYVRRSASLPLGRYHLEAGSNLSLLLLQPNS